MAINQLIGTDFATGISTQYLPAKLGDSRGVVSIHIEFNHHACWQMFQHGEWNFISPVIYPPECIQTTYKNTRQKHKPRYFPQTLASLMFTYLGYIESMSGMDLKINIGLEGRCGLGQ